MKKAPVKGLGMIRVRCLVLVLWYVWEVFWCQVAFPHGDLAGGPQYVFESLFPVVVGLGLEFPLVAFSGDALGFVFATLAGFFEGLPELFEHPRNGCQCCAQ